jgi:hypothetical protein
MFMAGEFTDGPSHDNINAAAASATQNNQPSKVETDVPGVFADATKDNMPVFDVDKDSFYSSVKADRKKIQFPGDTPVSQYNKGTNINRPFWLRHDGFLRKVK